MDCASEPTGFHYVGNCIRPPSEADSILIQATIGCSHNKCAFCGTYKDKRFAIKDRAILEQDLAFAQRYCRHQRRVFIMDGDALVMPMRHWEWLLGEIRRRLPWVERVGTYANSKAVALKSDQDLRRLRELGLGIVYYGLESGHPEVLKRVNKGATPEKHITQGRRVKQAGILLSVTVLLGVGGVELSLEHAPPELVLVLSNARSPHHVHWATLGLSLDASLPGPDEREAGAGCGCAAGPRAPWLALAALLPWVRRRRRRGAPGR